MITRRKALASGGATVVAAALPAGALAQDDQGALRLLADIAEEQLANNPKLATERGLDIGGRAALRFQLADYSEAGVQRTRQWLTERLSQLDRVALNVPSPSVGRDVEVVQYAFRSALTGVSFPYGRASVGHWLNSPYVVAQNVGAFIDVPRLLEADHPLNSRGDADAYLARLAAFEDALDAETARLHAATGDGVIPPAFLLDKAISQLRQLRDGDPAGKRLVTRLAQAYPTHAAPAERTFASSIAPALDRQIAELVNQQARAGMEAGVWRLPQGESYYAWALETATSTRRSPEDIHAQGLDDVRRLQSEMDLTLRSLGYTQGSVGARMAALGRDPKYGFPAGDAGRAEILAFARQAIETVRPKLPLAFTRQGGGNVEVRRIPEAEEQGAAGAYGSPGSADGTISGKFWINLHTTDRWTRSNLTTLAFHEALPGHVWQGEYSFDLRLIRALLHNNAFNEGWGLYAEQLADELGVYESDPVGRLGYLQSIAFRACRLVVDTGLHSQRWTRERAISWLAETNGQNSREVESEIDRYCSWPGQACGYKIPHSEINRLRDRAAAALGARYDVRAFNDAVVGAGWMPLETLARVVDEHIAQQRSGTTA